MTSTLYRNAVLLASSLVIACSADVPNKPEELGVTGEPLWMRNPTADTTLTAVGWVAGEGNCTGTLFGLLTQICG
jgi:hypothetical protein